MIRGKRQRGFSLLELLVVVVLIAILSTVGIKYFIDAMDKARAMTVEMLGWRFAQSTSTLHAWQKIPLAIESHKHGVDHRGVRWVDLEGTKIYLNEMGWPASTDAAASPLMGDQSVEGCKQLMDAVLESPMEDLRSSKTKVTDDFDVFAIDGRICRYQLAKVRDEAWFFDYSLETGRVQISVPKLKVEQYAGS